VLIVERPRTERLVVHLDGGAPDHPRRLAELPLSRADEPRPLLALLAPYARRLQAVATANASSIRAIKSHPSSSWSA
jgi:hypothetical protein